MGSIVTNIYDAACFWKPAVKMESAPEATFLVENTTVLKIRSLAFPAIITSGIGLSTIAFAASPLVPIAVTLLITGVVLPILFEKQINSALVNNLYEKKQVIPERVPLYLAGKQAVLKLLIDKLIEKKEFNNDLFIKIIGVCKDSDLIAHIFEKTAMKSTDFTEVQQHACIDAVCSNEKNLHLLISKGFNIDAKNADGQTVLLKTILEEKEVTNPDIKENPRIPLLLKWGAKRPHRKFKVEGSIRLNDWLLSHNKIKILRFLQTTYELRTASKRAELPEKPFSVYYWNLLKPAIENSATYKNNVNIRVLMIACILLNHPIVWSLTPLSTSISVISIMLIESIRATRALNTLAIQRFKNDFFHSSQTSEYIVQHPSLVQELIDSGADLSKPDLEGNTLLDAVLDLPDSNKNKVTLFQKIFDHIDKSPFLSYNKDFYCKEIIKQIPLGIYQHAREKGWYDNLSPDMEKLLFPK